MNWSRPRSAREEKNTYKKESFYGAKINISCVFCLRGLESKMQSLSNICRNCKDRRKNLFGFVHFVLCILNTKKPPNSWNQRRKPPSIAGPARAQQPAPIKSLKYPPQSRSLHYYQANVSPVSHGGFINTF